MLQVELRRDQEPLTTFDGQIGQVALDSAEFYISAEIDGQTEIEARAWQLIEGRRLLPKIEVKQQERYDNARTALMEAMTASGHLSRVEITGSVDEIGDQVQDRLLNGWDDSLPMHEKMRRFAELCNELKIQDTHKKIAKGELSPNTKIIEISDYPEAMGKAGEQLGYRWHNLKGMVRSTSFEYLGEGQWCRVIEQASRSNGTFASTSRFYDAQGIQLAGDFPTDIITLATPILTDEFQDGVIDVIRRLDQHSGPKIRYGETKHSKQVSYANLRKESARREKQIDFYNKKLAKLEGELDEKVAASEIPLSEKLQIYKEEIERHLTSICTVLPEYAEATFSSKIAARYFKRANHMIALGDIKGAERMLFQADFFKQDVIFCGVSISLKKANKFGLSVNSFNDLTEEFLENCEFTSLECPHCHKKNVKTTVTKHEITGDCGCSVPRN